MAEASARFNPGLLRVLARGTRAIGNWDEDAPTMVPEALEAARGCLGRARPATDFNGHGQ